MAEPKFKVGDVLKVNTELCNKYLLRYPPKGYVTITSIKYAPWNDKSPDFKSLYNYNYHGIGTQLPDDVLDYFHSYYLQQELRSLYG